MEAAIPRFFSILTPTTLTAFAILPNFNCLRRQSGPPVTTYESSDIHGDYIDLLIGHICQYLSVSTFN